MSSADIEYDVIIIGGGPGGYVSAIKAAQNNLKVALVEKDKMGGICLNWGCIPTKALLKSGEFINKLHKANDFGVVVDKFSFDLKSIVNRSRDISKNLNKGVDALMKKNGITVFNDTAKIISNHKVALSNQTLNTKNIVIATGSKSKIIPGLEPDGNVVWNYRNAMTPKKVPENLLIIGAGAIGVEFACFYNSLGSNVTIVENQENILSTEDDDVSALAKKHFIKLGISILNSTKVNFIEKSKDSITFELTSENFKETKVFDNVIMAIGVSGSFDNIGLETLGIKTNHGFIETNEFMQTNVPNIYAIGDVAGAPCLAHKASHEGIICIEKILNKNNIKTLNNNSIPSCIYSYPQIASLGLTEKAVIASGETYTVGRFPFNANGKAIASGETDGFIKTLFSANTGELLGVHMIGAEVTEMIQGYAIGKELETTQVELEHVIFPHPTMSEAMHEAVLDASDKAIHI
ncbi:dihydrolipoamide dehydrogenase [Psychromonas ingrahamii 37]|uniref:Dihydrolipoyl dehydrogenase n=1 Tax=Psychromonas ingrahamii (strain DSM 17664 / CCUG 51855 / 37) TaxID=357804 RepID=A1SYC1_PSYIN|nr:dihydrolipoyl dehydrogenase [Psychromonas ingrahamii]ABM04486.1 dihydrolipoamide dehydrogenase [Psychromonas ingrahamii 37]